MLRIAIGIVWRDGQVLVARRLDSATHAAGLCEFPGGKIEGDETPVECVAREVREETGLQVLVGDAYPIISWKYPEREVEIHPFDCQVLGGEARALESKSIAWVAPGELEAREFPLANASLIEEIIRRHG